MHDDAVALQRKLTPLWPVLDERSRRLVAANEAQSLGYGGITMVRRACGLSRKAIAKGTPIKVPGTPHKKLQRTIANTTTGGEIARAEPENTGSIRLPITNRITMRPCVDAPVFARSFLTLRCQFGRVRSCVRPSLAAVDRGP